jgi:hypothetical protein
VGESELARRLALKLVVVHEAVAVSQESLVSVAREHPGATLVAVTCPLPADGGRDCSEFASAVRSARSAGHSVVAVVNSAAPAANLRVDGPSVSVPAVDAFGMVSNAAVAAVVAALG